MKKIYLFLVLFCLSVAVKAQTAAQYIFSQSTSTYTAIGGTTIFGTGWDDGTVNALPIGFTFKYCGTNYTTFSCEANGWIGLGNTVANTTAALSNALAIAAMAEDLQSPSGGPITYAVTGSAPNRVLVVQYPLANHWPDGASGPLNFQIQLFETSNKISIVYGSCSNTSGSIYNGQVGITGNTSSDYNDRTSSTSWTATTAGTSNGVTVSHSSTDFPPTGLTFTWAPPPPVVATPTSLAYGPVTIGTSSVPQSFSMTGNFLTAGGGVITVTSSVPSAYGVSLSPTGPFLPTATLTYSGTAFPATNVYVQFSPTVSGSLPANAVITGGGIPAPVNVALSGTGAPACAGTPAVPSAIGSPTSGGPSTTVTLSLSGLTSGGLTYQWQSSPDNITFTNIFGATNFSFTYTGVTVNTYFRAVVACAAGGSSVNSNSQLITWVGLSSSCTPSNANNANSCFLYAIDINSFNLTGTASSISDPTGCTGAGYEDRTTFSCSVNAGAAYPSTVGYSSINAGVTQTWIDFNNDGTFSPSESVGGVNGFNTTPTVPLTIPAGIAPGTYKMRVIVTFQGSGYSYPTLDPCMVGYSYGDAHDYKIIINPPTPAVSALPASLPFGSVTVGTSSVPVKFFALSGTALSVTPLTVTPPAGGLFTISTDGVTWSTTPITVAYPAAYPFSSLSPTNIYVRFSPTATGASSGNITITGGSLAAAVNVAVSGTGAAVCSGTPVAGTASVSPTSGSSSNLFTLTLAGTSASGGLTYQWQSSPAGAGTFTNIVGAISAAYSFVGITSNTDFRCVVTCPTGASSNSTITTATAALSISTPTCGSSITDDCFDFSDWFFVTLTGAAGTTINTPTNGCPSSATAYDNETTILPPVSLVPGTSYSGTFTVGEGFGTTGYLMVWIDFNENGTFETSEQVMPSPVTTNTSGIPYAYTINIPAGIANGSYVMRYYWNWAGSSTPAPCASYSYGEIRDFKAVIGAGVPPGVPACSGVPNAGILSPSQISSCFAFTPSLFNVGESLAFTGMRYQWQSATSAGGPWTNVTGATGQGYIPTVATTGTIFYRDSVTCINGNGAAATSAQPLTLLVVPTAITGPTNVCNGSSITLASTPTPGTWISNSTSVATIGSLSGTLTGASAGTTTVTYTLPDGCNITAPITVNVQPAAITGPTSVCGLQSITLSETVTGGTWSSSIPSTASVGSTTGIVTGGTTVSGTPVISYTEIVGGCSTSYTVTVNSLSPITGTPSVCQSFTTVLANATPGGIWSSSNTAVATVGSSGTVSGVTIGPATISYTTPAGCLATQVVNVTAPPSTFTITGGGSFCSGPSTVHIGINGSNIGIAYQLINSFTGLVGLPFIGTGAPMDFGAYPAGTYSVVANFGTACSATMTGTATITALPLPTAYAVTGGGSYCPGGTGVAVFVNNSVIGTNYQLFVGAVPVGLPVPGTGAPINFGLQTTAGTYTVVATNAVTGCINNMSGSATVSISAPPTSFTMTGGGGYCVGGSGLLIGLSGSVVGTTYQLTLGGAPVGTPVAGTGAALSFGLQTIGGVYNVVATVTATGCTTTMSGTATITVNALPTVFTVTGGGGYCFTSATGVNVGINGSTIGVNYQLFYTPSGGATVAVGGPVPGTGVALNFPGPATGGTFTNVGSYSVVATNPTTTCTNNMFGSVAVFTNPLPSSFSVTGGGPYCTGAAGPHVSLSGSVSGTSYQLFNGATLTGAAAGTGSGLDFGSYTAAGTYTVIATTTATGCTATMSGSTTITINPLPTVYNVVLTGASSYCAGTTGVPVGLSSSNTGISYQLFNGTTPIVPAVAGSGSPISFGNQLAGSYTVVATTTATGCTSNMSGSASVSVNPIPTLYSVTGGGNYCSGAVPAGVHVGLSSTNTGITYALFRTGGAIISTLAGVGGSIDFGLQATAGTYKISAANTTTGCIDTMSGSAVVGISALPNNTFTVTGGGPYCQGGTGVVIGTSSSEAGVNYQLLNGGAPTGAPVAGTGSALSFGLQTVAGTYTVIASNATTTCNSTLTGSATVTINPLPTVASVTGGGGTYCAGTAGAPVGLSASTTGITYQLYSGAALVGSAIPGSGSSLNFGLEPAGTYTVVATNPLTTCSANMSGSATIIVNPAPVSTYAITGGGAYCTGGTGVPVGLNSSSPGINYQLMLGSAPVGSPVAGTGVSIGFGMQTAAGAYTVVGTNAVTGCSSAMTGTATVSINTLPFAYTVTGGGNYCPGTSGSLVGLSGSAAGTSYQLYNGSSPVGAAVTGTGSPISFGLQTATGTYTVVANTGATSCSGNMAGSVTIGIFPIPVAYNVTGGGNYCPSGTGVVVGLSGSNLGMSYQLLNGAGPVGAPLAGTGFSLNFGLQTASGIYTVVATNATTGCTNNMSGSAAVVISTPPTAYNVIGGGNYCTSGTGLHIGLNGSNTGVEYQLMNGSLPAGSPMAGTGSPIDFGAQTVPGTYTIVATSSSTTCTNTMAGSATITVIPLPTVFTVSAGGNYCAGAGGIDITLSSSSTGVNYQLYNGSTAVGIPVAGTGALLDFGSVTAAGTYTIVGTDASSSCASIMSGSSVVVVNALPTAYTVTGGGNYCSGGTGVHVMLSGSNTGIRYQLQIGGVATGAAVAGTGSAIDFGPQTGSGVYTVVATNTATTCTNTMTGTVTITINALPNTYTVTSSGSNYCSGGAGIDVQLSGSDAGISYQLYNGSTTIGSPVPGTGFEIDFGMETVAGTYTVVAINPGTTCNRTMTGAATIVINPLPIAYTVVGGGNYCNGGTGVHIGISGSNTGISYQLYNGGATVGSAMSGTGFALDFGLQTASGSYTVVATNAGTTCTNNMSGGATVAVTPLPTVYTVTGGGNYCASGTGVHIGLSGSTAGVNYQLYNGVTLVGAPVAGTGIAIDFGLQTGSGTYTVMAMNSTTSCSSLMAGSVNIGINALPATYAVTGGGNYCPGGAGEHVGLGGSNTGINYQLFNGGSPVGSFITGSGAPIDFGMKTAAGTYTVVATNAATSCTSNMSGSVSIGLNPAPVVFTVIGGGNYCAGGAGVHVGVNGSATGVNYQLYNGTATGFPVTGSGGPVDFGSQTAAGTYTVVASNGTTGCTSNMAGSATVVISPTVSPSVNVSTGVGDTICAGHNVTISTLTSNGGTAPSFSWSVNGSPVSATGTSYTYLPTDGDIVAVSMTSSAACATPATIGNSVTLTVMANGNPTIAVSATPGQVVCQGTMVNFNNTSTFGGTPSFTWIVNGSNVSTAASYSYMPANGDVIYCIMNSNYRCRLENAVTSNHITMEVDDSLLPVVTIAAHPGTNISKGESLTLTASVINAGSTPAYQWFVNGIAVPGATAASLTGSNYNNGDSVTCMVTSSGGCSGLVGFNSVRIVVGTTGVSNVVSNGSDIKLIPNPNKGTFSIKGSLGTTDDEEVSVEVSDLLGQVIYKNTVMVHGGNINEKVQLNGTLANGMYILSLRSATANDVFHVVIEQ